MEDESENSCFMVVSDRILWTKRIILNSIQDHSLIKEMPQIKAEFYVLNFLNFHAYLNSL